MGLLCKKPRGSAKHAYKAVKKKKKKISKSTAIEFHDPRMKNWNNTQVCPRNEEQNLGSISCDSAG